MTRRPDYVVHQVEEKDVTVDWFFTRDWGLRWIRQFILMIVGWAFAVLPVVITASALLHRGGRGGWWSYSEGFRMWDTTTRTLEFLMAVFIVGFLALYLVNRASARKRDQRKTYDEQRLARRLELAADLYGRKYGGRNFRYERKRIVIEPYEDLETYELRDRYREYGVD